MKATMNSVIFFLIFTSCSHKNYNVSDFKSETLRYVDLPIEVQEFLKHPSDEYKEYTPDGFCIGIKPMVCLQCDDFKFEIVNSFVSSWVDHYNIIDVKSKKKYRIDYGKPYPFIICKKKLYIPVEHNILVGGFDDYNSEFICYYLK